jgi:hypothetical protein
MPEGAVLAVLSDNPEVRDDLPAWCRLERHGYGGVERDAQGLDRHLIVRGPHPRWNRSLEDLTNWPARVEASTGLAPRGAWAETGSPASPFSALDRDQVSPEDGARLYAQGAQSQWNVETDIPWARAAELSPELESAVSQIFSFLAENELAALYVPSRFIARIPPAYVETAQALALQLADEARHIEAFLRRARLRGGPAPLSTVPTAASLLTLFESEDFTESTFLLSVLGEGTFLDLLSFVERHAPDPITAEIARRAKLDETRHVHFGLAHVARALRSDSTLFSRLEAAVRRRALALSGAVVPGPVQDALTVLAAGSTEPGALARGHDAFRSLLEVMRENRVKRLRHAGFSDEQAAILSDLHTPNFM